MEVAPIHVVERGLVGPGGLLSVVWRLDTTESRLDISTIVGEATTPPNGR